MNTFFSKVSAFVREEEGLTMVEYAIGAAVIAAVALTIFTKLGTSANTAADGGKTALDSSVAAGTGIGH